LMTVYLCYPCILHRPHDSYHERVDTRPFRPVSAAVARARASRRARRERDQHRASAAFSHGSGGNLSSHASGGAGSASFTMSPSSSGTHMAEYDEQSPRLSTVSCDPRDRDDHQHHVHTQAAYSRQLQEDELSALGTPVRGYSSQGLHNADGVQVLTAVPRPDAEPSGTAVTVNDFASVAAVRTSFPLAAVWHFSHEQFWRSEGGLVLPTPARPAAATGSKSPAVQALSHDDTAMSSAGDEEAVPSSAAAAGLVSPSNVRYPRGYFKALYLTNHVQHVVDDYLRLVERTAAHPASLLRLRSPSHPVAAHRSAAAASGGSARSSSGHSVVGDTSSGSKGAPLSATASSSRRRLTRRAGRMRAAAGSGGGGADSRLAVRVDSDSGEDWDSEFRIQQEALLRLCRSAGRFVYALRVGDMVLTDLQFL